MEHHIRKKYHFALSSFSRLYGVKACDNNQYKKFCAYWANKELDGSLPLCGLTEVDIYFQKEFDKWKNNW